MDFEHPRLIRRGDLVRVHGGAQGEAPAEGAERPFAVMRIAVLPVLDTVLDQAFPLDIIANNPIDRKVVELSFSQPYSLVEHSMYRSVFPPQGV
jgi:hypothetical protein